MNIGEYKEKVIELFKSGNAHQDQWKAMAEAVLSMSEGNSGDIVYPIDIEVDSENAWNGEKI